MIHFRSFPNSIKLIFHLRLEVAGGGRFRNIAGSLITMSGSKKVPTFEDEINQQIPCGLEKEAKVSLFTYLATSGGALRTVQLI